MATAQEIDISLILPVDGQKHKMFDAQQEMNAIFLEGVDREGILQPISVRPRPDGKYDLVFGQKRLWAAKKLKHTKILAIVGNWRSEELAFVRVIENLHRKQMSSGERAKAMRAMLDAFKEAYGPDPGRAVGGQARATAATTVSTGRGDEKVFAKNNDVSPYPVKAGQATDVASVAGLSEELPAGGLPNDVKSFSKRVSEITGLSQRRSRDEILIAEALSNDQLDVLDACAATKNDMLRFASIEDVEQRKVAVNLVAANRTFDQAIKEASEWAANERAASNPMARASVRPEDMTDLEFAECYCGKQVSTLQDRSRFLADIALYRATLPALAEYKKREAKRIRETRRLGYTPLGYLLGRTITISNPAQWYICTGCGGKNVDRPECKDCHGSGYKLRHDNER